MSLTTALNTGLSGLNAHSQYLDVIGNNITNVNTHGYKASRAIFQTQLSRTFNLGTAPSAESGGTNPVQVGLGVKFAGTQRDFSNGALQPTGVNTHLALEGNGFFIVEQGKRTFYTRAGAFDLNANNKLVGPNGGVVQGFGVDSNFNIVPGQLQDIQIPVGEMTIAQATENVTLAGNLNAAGALSTQGSITRTQAFTDLGTGAAATATSQLTDLSSNGTTPVFTAGEVITIRGAQKGGRQLDSHTFEIGATNTTGADAFGTSVLDFMNFVESALGINESLGAAGVSIDGSGRIVITGNTGAKNNLKVETTDIVTSGGSMQPFAMQQVQEAKGESVTTSIVAYDSLGTPLTLNLTLTLESKDASGTTWRYYAHSADDTDLDSSLGTGTLQFNTFGKLVGVSDPTLTIDRQGTGANALSVTLNFRDGQSALTSLADRNSSVAAVSQDGSPIGTLDSFGIGENGIITGVFTNGLTRTIGQVAVGTFANPEGLVATGGNMFTAGPNSGLAVEVAPMSFGAGRVVSGALELSNVDLGQQFVNLISASMGFSASSRVITTANKLMQQLLATGR